MASVSIESLIESEDVSYIDEDIGKEIVKPIKESEGHPIENEDESFTVPLSNVLKSYMYFIYHILYVSYSWIRINVLFLQNVV